MKDYSEETRRETIRLYFSEGLGARRIVKRLGLSSTALVRQWVLKYTVYGEESFTRKCKRVAMTGIVPQEYKKYCDHLEAENQMLQAENNFFKEVMRSNCSSKYQMISECSSLSVARLCKLGDVSRSGYYKWKAAQENKPTTKDDAELMSLIREIYENSGGTYGYRRIDKALRSKGIVVNHKRLQRILRENDIQSKLYALRRITYNRLPPAKNLLMQDFTAEKPSEKWTTDLTYFRIGKKAIQLMCVMDLFDGRIVYHTYRRSFTGADVVRGVESALEKNGIENGLILHSDQGPQFRSAEYAAFLKEMGIVQSMSRAGNCFDNARIESFFGHMKAELPLLFPYFSIEELQDSIDRYIDYYNNERIRG